MTVAGFDVPPQVNLLLDPGPDLGAIIFDTAEDQMGTLVLGFGPGTLPAGTAFAEFSITPDGSIDNGVADLRIAWNDTPDFATPISEIMLTDAGGVVNPVNEITARFAAPTTLFLVFEWGEVITDGTILTPSISATAADVPLPASLLLLASALAGLGLIQARRGD